MYEFRDARDWIGEVNMLKGTMKEKDGRIKASGEKLKHKKP